MWQNNAVCVYMYIYIYKLTHVQPPIYRYARAILWFHSTPAKVSVAKLLLALADYCLSLAVWNSLERMCLHAVVKLLLLFQMEVIVGDFGMVVVPRDGVDVERIMNQSSVLRKNKVGNSSYSAWRHFH